MADEVVFVLGPPLVTLLATLIAPPVGFLTGVFFGVVGGLWLAAQPATEPPLHPVDAAAPTRRLAALTPTLLVVVVTYLGVGTVFGGLDVVVIGFAEEQGAPRWPVPCSPSSRAGAWWRGWPTAWLGCRARSPPGSWRRRSPSGWPPSCCGASARFRCSSAVASSPASPSPRCWCRAPRWSSREWPQACSRSRWPGPSPV
ncbi:hypothetical protein [Blastococcus brunescens]|uniref:Uncharacterized protein n=1 Tax=Blastococcus brunescens TaxID=1564165 RepID=A0ABZ1B1L0_9ACTN|nr:hypothetical protein [Blastococcus sp. BMG 8361]WRL63638.1 hypothetical protein U6N30_28875 [Blastococcus sp. BMG 8361]